jgi:phage head maturation protease
MFWTRKASWLQEVRDGRNIEIRQLESVELVEVGPVTFPAYQGTTTGVRGVGDVADVRREYDELQAARKRDAAASWVDVRLRLRRVH